MSFSEGRGERLGVSSSSSRRASCASPAPLSPSLPPTPPLSPFPSFPPSPSLSVPSLFLPRCSSPAPKADDNADDASALYRTLVTNPRSSRSSAGSRICGNRAWRVSRAGFAAVTGSELGSGLVCCGCEREREVGRGREEEEGEREGKVERVERVDRRAWGMEGEVSGWCGEDCGIWGSWCRVKE